MQAASGDIRANRGGCVAWWGWLLVGWVVLAVPLTFWLGAAAIRVKRRERELPVLDLPDEREQESTVVRPRSRRRAGHQPAVTHRAEPRD